MQAPLCASRAARGRCPWIRKTCETARAVCDEILSCEANNCGPAYIRGSHRMELDWWSGSFVHNGRIRARTILRNAFRKTRSPSPEGEAPLSLLASKEVKG